MPFVFSTVKCCFVFEVAVSIEIRNTVCLNFELKEGIVIL